MHMRLRILGGWMLVILLGGCAGEKRWEIVAENKSDTPCTLTVLSGDTGNRKSHIDNLAKGKVVLLEVGQPLTKIHTIKVVCGKYEEELQPGITLTPGKRFLIVVKPDGQLETLVSEK